MKTLLTQSLNNTKVSRSNVKGRRVVTYGNKGRSWTFCVGNYVLITKAPGGRATAERIVDILSKGVKTNEKGSDILLGSARVALERLTQIKRLEITSIIPDYIPNPDETARLEQNRLHPETVVPVSETVETAQDVLFDRIHQGFVQAIEEELATA